MAQLFDIKKVTVRPRTLEAVVELSPSAPERTSDDPEGTARVMSLVPELADHVCLGDSAPHFGEVVEDTELAHLLEHVTVELLARTDIAGDVASGQTVEVGERTYQLTFACPDDVLVTGALSSAVWVLQWAYSGGGDPEPDIDATAEGLVDLVASLGDGDAADGEPAEPESAEPALEPEPAQERFSFAEEPAVEIASDAAEEEFLPEDADNAEPAPELDQGAWDGMDDVPRPHLVR